jgi:dihydroorotase
MKILIKKATVIDPSSDYNGNVVDLLINNGMIDAISMDIHEEDATIISGEDLYVSQGWVDLKSHFCDPGEEHKETVESGLDAAAFGGYTHVAVLPSTKPVVDGKTEVEYLLRKAADHVTSLHPIGAITKIWQEKTLQKCMTCSPVVFACSQMILFRLIQGSCIVPCFIRRISTVRS